MSRPLRHHPRLRVVQSDPTDALGDHPETARAWSRQRWMYRLGALAMAVSVLGASAALVAGVAALGRALGGAR